MNTTAGSFALLGSVVPRDAHVAATLRAAGAILLGKANLSEWANFRGNVPSGFSGRGGQTSGPYVPLGDPCGSSSGSGVASAIGLAAAALRAWRNTWFCLKATASYPSHRAQRQPRNPVHGHILNSQHPSTLNVVPNGALQLIASPSLSFHLASSALLGCPNGSMTLRATSTPATGNFPLSSSPSCAETRTSVTMVTEAAVSVRHTCTSTEA